MLSDKACRHHRCWRHHQISESQVKLGAAAVVPVADDARMDQAAESLRGLGVVADGEENAFSLAWNSLRFLQQSWGPQQSLTHSVGVATDIS